MVWPRNVLGGPQESEWKNSGVKVKKNIMKPFSVIKFGYGTNDKGCFSYNRIPPQLQYCIYFQGFSPEIWCFGLIHLLLLAWSWKRICAKNGKYVKKFYRETSTHTTLPNIRACWMLRSKPWWCAIQGIDQMDSPYQFSPKEKENRNLTK